jgi:hypothetical protein
MAGQAMGGGAQPQFAIPGPGAAAPAAAAAGGSIEDRLAKLKGLKDKGLISATRSSRKSEADESLRVQILPELGVSLTRPTPARHPACRTSGETATPPR